ncbi:MAG: dTDP-4-dehydrorhamnose 3,5-epimerase [Candidatus Riflebacteria bacterium]|nr:dTDP-4-dehydrorhamnose 3,5-epimerase [Candidatus Riflebacteria bacterium]
MHFVPFSIVPSGFRISLGLHEDQRGFFVKTFHSKSFTESSLPTKFEEDFYSLSKKNVLRGLHFQVPPFSHDKLIICAQGEIYDVVVDLRRDSPSFGKFETFILNSKIPEALFVPKGLAHGFCVLSEEALVLYKTTTIHSPEHDKGILWNSVSIPWPCQNPILSARDSSFPSFSNFSSPFIFGNK